MTATPISASMQPVGARRSASVDVERGGRDAAWDAFVDSAPGGHHVQTTRWAAVKEALGWRAVRVLARREGEIVAGCQLLVRRLGRFGGVAYCPRGPLAAPGDAASLAAVLDSVDAIAREERLVYIKVQPPVDRHDMAASLAARGFVESDLDASPTATVRVDLGHSEAQLLAGMRAGTRSNVRKAARKGVTVRLGGASDIATFGRLVAATSTRQGFPAYPVDYYEAVWRAFSADDRAALLVAEHDGAALSAALLIGYADAVTYKMGGWSGERTDVHPNELLHWAGMRWGRERGYRWYDFDGIPRPVASALVTGAAPEGARRGVAHFKLGFGGEVALFPSSYDRAYRPLLAAALSRLAPRLGGWTALAQRVLGRSR